MSRQVDWEMMELFVAESREHLATVEEEILALEQGVADPERVNRLYRALHTVKGAAAFLDLQDATKLAHALEDVVGRVRAGAFAPDGELAEALLKGVDRLKALIEAPAETSHPIDDEVATLREQLARESRAEPPATKAEPAAGPMALGALVTAAAVPPEAPKPDQGQAAGPEPAATAAPKGTGAGDDSVRISLALLDRLMNLGSELVLVRNQAIQALDAGDTDQLAAISQRLNVVTSELQASIMQTRMRPVGEVFARFGRVVRDLARKLGKDVATEIYGTEVELDKNIIEAIKDPLTHLVRNAVDHGIESPRDREAKGKPARGVIVLNAFQQSGQVHIQIRDDGEGMDPQALTEAALQRGLIDPVRAQEMRERDAFELIFAPGFTMAEEVTNVSGRGVGMDVVKSAFNRLGGIVEVASSPDVGTTITVRLPLTLAIVPALIFTVEDVCFAVPQINIDEVAWLHGDQTYQSLKMVDDQEVFWLRDRQLPILRLSKLLFIPKTFVDPATGARRRDGRTQRPDRRSDREQVNDDRRLGSPERRVSCRNSVYILVLKLGIERFGLLVDEVIDTEEIVVKGLHDQLKDCRTFSGTTVLGDGRIAMILDIPGLVEIAGLKFRDVDGAVSQVKSSSEAEKTALLFDVGGAERFAVPLGAITRVEEISPKEVQVAKGREYLNYRGSTLPLVRLDQVVDSLEASYSPDLLYVIIPKSLRPFGVVAARILDTVRIDTDIDTETVTTPGVLGSALVDGALTLFLDFSDVIERLEPGWLRAGAPESVPTRRVVLVEDSGFFAAQITNYLKGAGLEVIRTRNGKEGFEQILREPPDVVVSDIEMPVMGGLELARQVRGDARTRSIPLYAISSLSAEAISSQALAAGFDGFQTKADQGRLCDQLVTWCLGQDES